MEKNLAETRNSFCARSSTVSTGACFVMERSIEIDTNRGL